MAEGDGGVTEVSRQTVVMDKELERIAQEKTELVRRMEALTIRESALEARASEIPELYAELAARRRAEKRSELPAAGFATSLSPQDPVGSVWENMRDTHTVRESLETPCRHPGLRRQGHPLRQVFRRVVRAGRASYPEWVRCLSR